MFGRESAFSFRGDDMESRPRAVLNLLLPWVHHIVHSKNPRRLEVDLKVEGGGIRVTAWDPTLNTAEHFEISANQIEDGSYKTMFGPALAKLMAAKPSRPPC